MTLREIMSKTVVRIRPDEPVGVAARALSRYNIGALPVCGGSLRTGTLSPGAWRLTGIRPKPP